MAADNGNPSPAENSWLRRCRRAVPLCADLRTMDRGGLTDDLIAGTITAVLLVPQALAYALLAGLPPEVGLYASIVPAVIYALLGTSRTLAVGPVAVGGAMVAAALTPYAGGDPQKYLAGALTLSALTGAILLALGTLRMGWLTAFISNPVLSGFTSGSAIFIIGTQIAALTGITVAPDAGFADVLRTLANKLPQANLAAVAFGLAAIILLAAARRPLARILTRVGIPPTRAGMLVRAAPLAVVVVATAIAKVTGAHAQWGVAVVGTVPTGLPRLRLDFLAQPGWLALLPSAAMMALVAYVGSISVAKALAFRRREKVDPDQELRALGIANIAAACAGAMPVAGGLSRSMVNVDAGARTQLAAIVTACWVALAALLFTGLLTDLPKAVLAAIIVVAVWQLVDFAGLRRTWRYDRGDGAAEAATLVGVLAFGIEIGLMIGVGLALLLFLYRTSRPHIAVVGRIAGTEHFRNIHRHVVETWPHLLLVRVDENLYFANVPKVESEVQNLVVDRAGLRDLVLILSGVAYIDASALGMLENLETGLSATGIRLHLAEVKGPVLDRLRHSELLARLSAQRIHLSTEQAVAACTAAARDESALGAAPALPAG